MAAPRRMPSVQTQVRRLVSFAGSVPEWVESASCTQTDPALFFAKDSTKAKRVCANCEVRQKCLDDALDFESQDRLDDQTLVEPHGVRGGLTGTERKKMISVPKAERKAELKAEAFADALNGMRPGRLAEKYGIALDTVYRWRREAHEQAEQQGVDESGAA